MFFAYHQALLLFQRVRSIPTILTKVKVQLCKPFSVSANSLAIGSLGYQQGTRNASGNLPEIENISPTEDKRTKRDERNESQWKLARNSGIEYVSSTKSKKVIRVRKIKPPCKDSCRLNCKTRITEGNHKNFFDKYWSFGDSQRQRDYLSSCKKPVKPKYQYQRSNSNWTRIINFILQLMEFVN